MEANSKISKKIAEIMEERRGRNAGGERASIPAPATNPITVAEVFAAAGLTPQGVVPWRAAVPERRPGVYVVALVSDANATAPEVHVSSLSPAERQRWITGQPVIYIGRSTRPLARRIEEFVRHKYGDSAPHRGGQAIKLLKCDLWVHWATADGPMKAEAQMIKAFRGRVGRLPFANRKS